MLHQLRWGKASSLGGSVTAIQSDRQRRFVRRAPGRRVLIAAVAFGIAGGAAEAATGTAALAVSVTITAGCSISTTGGGTGGEGAGTASADPWRAVSVSCTHPTPYAVGAGSGLPQAPRLAIAGDALTVTVTY
jgi:hypothetical protein